MMPPDGRVNNWARHERGHRSHYTTTHKQVVLVLRVLRVALIRASSGYNGARLDWYSGNITMRVFGTE